MLPDELLSLILSYIPLSDIFGPHLPCISKKWKALCWESEHVKNTFWSLKNYKKSGENKKYIKKIQCIDGLPSSLPNNQFTHVKIGDSSNECGSYQSNDIVMPDFPSVTSLELSFFYDGFTCSHTYPNVQHLTILASSVDIFQTLFDACPNVKTLSCFFYTQFREKETLVWPSHVENISLYFRHHVPDMSILSTLDTSKISSLQIKSATYLIQPVMHWALSIAVKELRLYCKYSDVPNVPNTPLDHLTIDVIPEQCDQALSLLVNRGGSLKSLQVTGYATEELVHSIIKHAPSNELSLLKIGIPTFLLSMGCPKLTMEPCIALFESLTNIRELHLCAGIPATSLSLISDKSMPQLKKLLLGIQDEALDLGVAHFGVTTLYVRMKLCHTTILDKFPNLTHFTLFSLLDADLWNKIAKSKIRSLCLNQAEFKFSKKLALPRHLRKIENMSSYCWHDSILQLLIVHNANVMPFFGKILNSTDMNESQIEAFVMNEILNSCVEKHDTETFAKIMKHIADFSQSDNSTALLPKQNNNIQETVTKIKYHLSQVFQFL